MLFAWLVKAEKYRASVLHRPESMKPALITSSTCIDKPTFNDDRNNFLLFSLTVDCPKYPKNTSQKPVYRPSTVVIHIAAPPHAIKSQAQTCDSEVWL